MQSNKTYGWQIVCYLIYSMPIKEWQVRLMKMPAEWNRMSTEDRLHWYRLVKKTAKSMLQTEKCSRRKYPGVLGLNIWSFWLEGACLLKQIIISPQMYIFISTFVIFIYCTIVQDEHQDRPLSSAPAHIILHSKKQGFPYTFGVAFLNVILVFVIPPLQRDTVTPKIQLRGIDLSSIFVAPLNYNLRIRELEVGLGKFQTASPSFLFQSSVLKSWQLLKVDSLKLVTLLKQRHLLKSGAALINSYQILYFSPWKIQSIPSKLRMKSFSEVL